MWFWFVAERYWSFDPQTIGRMKICDSKDFLVGDIERIAQHVIDRNLLCVLMAGKECEAMTVQLHNDYF